ncbi:MAG: AAA ATPase [Parcubacteria group bacterium GW2011_GWA1_44_13]|uniref:AAA ATPase n=1 Tax=Candidatus Nomurabacteria bacterium GW2011_GWB1_44_12 TaxID=1618748 RepID=A0A837I9K7_9BACT|nr:MAG: AAA ATPase [Candidatus Nomurabacteria bacterium GW2011_GWB1_44_12]KKT37443.1 MAG: AAA ATPase [Parcubacteria group bacterium GW2011_GWA1_44_13]HBB43860.1 helicase [Candidatus Yonathbacteria bacterium]
MTQDEAFEILKTGRNVFVTGPAGSGKTHLVNRYIAYMREHDIDMGITASTGIAATHMGGVTIHSWSGIGISAHLSPYDMEAMLEKGYLYKRFEKVKVLIIDEVSMLHHFRLDLVNNVLKTMKHSDKPFGGIQVILCGDFFQLPPVSRAGEPETHFIYKSDAWREAEFTICYLSGQFRQEDDVTISILNEIRSGEVSDTAREHLRSRHNVRSSKFTTSTKLFTHNADVDTLNDTELDRIEGDEIATYMMESRGKEAIAVALKKSCLAPETLRLKVGARVMCVKNNFEAGYVNGTLGVVVSCDEMEDPVIKTVSGKRIVIPRASWKVEEDGKVKAEILQYPLRLAWAITVHKSQGMSLDAVEVDLSKSFEPGMGYVALSRVRSLEGLTILGINENALRVHDEVREIDATFQQVSAEAREELKKMDKKDLAKVQEEFLARSRPTQKEKKLATHKETELLIAEKKSLAEIAEAREMTLETIVSHIEKLIEEESKVGMEYLKYEISRPHFLKIEKAIEELLKENKLLLLTPIKNKVGPNVSFLHIRLARALLGHAPKNESK